MTFARHTLYMTIRHGRELLRRPWWIAITLVQPVIWLLLFGPLFSKVVDIPGFTAASGTGDYIEFLAPGVLIMTAFFSAGWSGMGIINDLNRGIMDRLLVPPVSRGALIAGRLVQGSIVIVIQSLIIIALALALGGSFAGGVAGVAILIAVAGLIGAAFAAFSNGIALLARKEETLIALVNFLMMPLTMLAAAFMPLALAPGWMRDVAGFNPVNWAIEAGREAAMGSTDWGLVASRTGLLVAFLTVSAVFATRAFRTYQRAA